MCRYDFVQRNSDMVDLDLLRTPNPACTRCPDAPALGRLLPRLLEQFATLLATQHDDLADAQRRHYRQLADELSDPQVSNLQIALCTT